MANVNNQFQVTRNGQHTREDIGKILRPVKARDNIKAAFAGNENKGPSGQKKSTLHSTQVKSRTTTESKTRTPIR